jgi:hypothetical protein
MRAHSDAQRSSISISILVLRPVQRHQLNQWTVRSRTCSIRDTADINPGTAITDYLIVGGADHKTGEANDGNVRFEGLEGWTRNLVPDLGRETHRWSGQFLEPVDHTAPLEEAILEAKKCSS